MQIFCHLSLIILIAFIIKELNPQTPSDSFSTQTPRWITIIYPNTNSNLIIQLCISIPRTANQEIKSKWIDFGHMEPNPKLRKKNGFNCCQGNKLQRQLTLDTLSAWEPAGELELSEKKGDIYMVWRLGLWAGKVWPWCLDIPNARHEAAASAPFLDVRQCDDGMESHWHRLFRDDRIVLRWRSNGDPRYGTPTRSYDSPQSCDP